MNDTQAASWFSRAVIAFPRGGLLPEENWRRRHMAMSLVLVWHFPILFGYGLAQGYPLPHALVDAVVPTLFGVAAFTKRLNRSTRSILVATGLLACSVALVHLSHGLIEM